MPAATRTGLRTCLRRNSTDRQETAVIEEAVPQEETPQAAPVATPQDLALLIAEITADADSDQEQLWAFRQAFEDNVPLPAHGNVVGEPVVVVGFDFDGNERRGLTAKCRRRDGREYLVAAADLTVSRGGEASRFLAAYRKWIGLPPYPLVLGAPKQKDILRSHRAAVDRAAIVELAVLSLKRKAARCRVLASGEELTLRATRLRDLVPGEIAAVRPAREWIYAGNRYLSGEIESTRLEAAALQLVPLKLEARSTWNPAEHYWGDDGEPIEEWAKPIIARGPRPQFEMEQVLPGMDPNDPDSDPIGRAVDLTASGDWQAAYTILMDLCQADLRCLDAHAHLGNLIFDGRPDDAIRHYEAGFRIGELSLPKDFDGVLSWGWIDNRPFLRCMHGFGLCLWRLKRFDEARHILERMLWLNPSDNQGVRFLRGDLRAKVAWEDSMNR